LNTARIDGLLLALVLALGSIQMVGWAIDSPLLEPLGKASVASPLPLVFSSHDGLETFAQDFALEIRREGQALEKIPLDSARYSLLEGSYNRRNTYGAVFSYGPILDQKAPDLLSAVLQYGICDPGALLAECDIPGPFKSIVVEARAKSTPNSPWRKEVTCP